MHKQVVIIGAGPSGLLLARMLFNRGLDCLIIENRNERFLKKLNRGGFLESKNVKALLEENANTQISTVGIPLTQIDFQILGEKIPLPLFENEEKKQAVIFDQKKLVAELLDGLKADKVPIIFEAKAQRYEGLESDKVKIVYTLDGQLYDMTSDYVVGCDGFRGISRRSIPRDLRSDKKEELPYAWLEWIVDKNPPSAHPIIAFHEDGFAMQSINANGQTRYYLQVKRGIEMDDLAPHDEIWDSIENRLGTTVLRGEMLNLKLDYMRSFYTDLMQHGRLFIAGDAAHQVPRLGSKGINLALADAVKLATAFFNFYKKKDDSFLKNYTNNCLATNLKTLEYTNYLNRIFHKNEGNDTDKNAKEIHQLLTDQTKKEALIKYLIG